jgi:DNA-binding MarR family transcriptional regulator
MLDKVAVSRAVTKLIKHGRIDRQFADSDRRRSILNLSEDGRELHDKVATLALRFEHDLLQGMSTQDIDTLNALIDRLLAQARLVGSP